MGGTMMDSTKRSLAGAIRDAKGGGANAGPKNSGAKYFGAWDGGSGGTFGKAARAVGEPRQQQQQNPQRIGAPLGPSQAQNSPMGASGHNNLTGRRQRIRPNSAGAQSIWHTSTIGPLPKAPPPGTSPRIPPRPNTAQPSRDRQSLTPSECTLARGPLSLTSPKLRQHSPVKPANVPRSPASTAKGPPAFADPFKSAALSRDSRTPFSIMAALQHGLTFDDAKDMHASRALAPPEGVPPVSAPHEHITQPRMVHPPSPPSFRPPPLPTGSTMGDQYDDTKPHKCQDAASGDASKVTLHPSAATNLGTLASIDEDASICGKEGSATLRQQLSHAAAVTPHRVQQIAKAMRAALKQREKLYRTKQMQLDTLMAQEGDGMGQVAVDGFSRLATCLGVDITHPEALAFCTHHGFTSLAIPCDALCSLLLANSSSKATSEAPTKRQPFSRTSAPTVANCKISYRPCKTPVFTPTEWPRTGEAIVERSAQLPDARLLLDFVYGYAGFNNTSCNLFYNCNRQVLYYVAGVAVCYTPPADSSDGSGAPIGHKQRFFLGHDDDIKSLALCPSAIQVDNRSFPAGALAATGQVCSTSHGPYICVWNSVGCEDSIRDIRTDSPDVGVEEIRRIELEKSYRGVGALAFSPDGRFLAAVALDNVHSVMVFDWRCGTIISEGRGFAGEPPQVYGATWNPHVKHPSKFHFLTWGKKHCKLWSQSQPISHKTLSAKSHGTQYTSKQLSFGRFDLQNVHSVVFLPVSHAIVLGLGRGDLLVFSGTAAVRSISAHRSGPQFIADDGSVTFSGLRGLALHHGDSCLLTAGADGRVCTWDVRDGTLTDASLKSSLQLEPSYGGATKAPVVRALCVSPLDKDIMVGTSSCDIWEVNDNKQEVLMYGHGGSMHAVAWHPVRTAVFATACEAQRVFVFDATARSTIKTAATSMASRAVAWSCRPLRGGTFHHLALGGAKGRILVLDEEALQPICEARDCAYAIHDLKYNPQATVLAAACADRHVDLYTVSLKRYSRIARCAGHSAAIRSLDWRADGKVLQSACAACELLYWNGTTGKQTTECQRDAEWATWTCSLGFPVMGIWYGGADATDINAVSRDPSGRYLAAADDRGLVRLLNYPAVVSDAPSRGYVGHSAHVTGVRFSESSSTDPMHGLDDGTGVSWVATCGGSDRAVFQFRLEEIHEVEAPVVAEPEAVWGPLDARGKVFGWTKQSVGCSTGGSEKGANTPGRVPDHLAKAETGGPCVEEAQRDAGDGSDDGGWGDV